MSEEARNLARRVLMLYPDVEGMTEELYDSLEHPEVSFAWQGGEDRETTEKDTIRLVLAELIAKVRKVD